MVKFAPLAPVVTIVSPEVKATSYRKAVVLNVVSILAICEPSPTKSPNTWHVLPVPLVLIVIVCNTPAPDLTTVLEVAEVIFKNECDSPVSQGVVFGVFPG